MVTLGLETVVIGNPGKSEALALGGDPVGRSLVGGASADFVAVVVLAVASDLLVGLLAGGAIGSLVAPVAGLDSVALIGRADDGDGRSVTLGVGGAGGSGGDGDEGGDQELLKGN